VKDVKHHSIRLDDIPSASSDTPIVGTGRGVGRMLRHENSKKMTIHNKRHLEMESANRKKHTRTTNAGTAVARPSTYNSISSRYIATLDGAPLPTPLAEAMRRSRCMFIGAGIVSYAITRYLSNNRQHDTMGRYQLDTTPRYSYGYNYWINTKSIRLWNERITNGKSLDEMDIVKQLQTQQNADDSTKIISNENATYLKTQDAVFGGIYNTMKWINLQLGRDLDEPPFSLIRHWKSINTHNLEPLKEEPNTVEDNSSGDRRGDDEAQAVNDPTLSLTKSGSQQSQKSSNVWNVAVTSVDVLGTSMRHLLVSTYQLASSVATVGRKGQRESKEDVDTMSEVQSDPTTPAAGDRLQ